MVIQQYQDPRVGKYLQYGYWYQAHHSQLHNLWCRSLLALVIVVWAILAYLVYNFVLSQAQYNQVLLDLTRANGDVLVLQQARAPQPPQIGAVSVFSGENQTRADFMALAENPNRNWRVAVHFIFVWAEGQTTSATAFILPGGKAVLASRGVTVNNLPLAAELRIIGMDWYRLRTPAETERVTAVSTGIIIASPRAEQANGATRAVYTVENRSVYDWLSPRFTVILYQGAAPVAIGVNEVPQLLSGLEQEIEYRWRQALPGALGVAVYPELDPFDASSYHLPTGGDYAL